MIVGAEGANGRVKEGDVGDAVAEILDDHGRAGFLETQVDVRKAPVKLAEDL